MHRIMLSFLALTLALSIPTCHCVAIKSIHLLVQFAFNLCIKYPINWHLPRDSERNTHWKRDCWLCLHWTRLLNSVDVVATLGKRMRVSSNSAQTPMIANKYRTLALISRIYPMTSSSHSFSTSLPHHGRSNLSSKYTAEFICKQTPQSLSGSWHPQKRHCHIVCSSLVIDERTFPVIVKQLSKTHVELERGANSTIAGGSKNGQVVELSNLRDTESYIQILFRRTFGL